MANFIQKLVSKNKRRYKDEKYDLDLTYVTNRLIAMSFPGGGFRKIYRNSVDKIRQFLDERHPQRYKLFNLSMNDFQYEKFYTQVAVFQWPDHHSPPMDYIIKACDMMLRWMLLDENNVGVVNWDAGKGRTGTFISCFLLYSRRFMNPTDALEYYKKRRFIEGGGVTHPSQRRFVYNFFSLLQDHQKGPLVLNLQQIIMHTAPHMSGKKSRPYIDIYDDITQELLWSSKEGLRSTQPEFVDDWEIQRTHMLWYPPNLPITGAILCHLKNHGHFKNDFLCRFSFNMAFIPANNIFFFDKKNLDPDKFRDHKKVHENFSLTLAFAKECNWTVMTELDQRWERWKCYLRERKEDVRWREIALVLDGYCQLAFDPSVLLFGNEEDDIDIVIAGLSNSPIRKISFENQTRSQSAISFR